MQRAAKIDERLVRDAFANPARVDHYRSQATEIGLWDSERIVFDRTLPRDGRILDLGCGTGRIALGLARRGFTGVVGIDLTPELIAVAELLAADEGLPVEFSVGNARALELGDASFDAVVFGFNGLMQIPGRGERRRALGEVARILRSGGVFVFTAHDRGRGTREQLEFWEREAARWSTGSQNPRLHDLGDIVFESSGREQYIHIPSRQDVLDDLAAVGLLHIEDCWRPDIADERPAVQASSKPCRFWITRRP